MNIVEVLYQLENIYSRRGVGHTRLLMTGLENSDKGAIIASNRHYARDLSSQCKGNIKPVSIDNLEILRGSNFPIALDNSAIRQIIIETSRYIGFLWKEKSELNVVNMTLRSELNSYKNPIDKRIRYSWKEKIAMIWKIIND